ncbi:MAG: lactate utilization protein C, partial [Propionicimonas sp.]
MNARDAVLARIRTSLADVVQPDPVLDVPIEWAYAQATAMPDVLTQFVERTADYKALVERVPSAEVPGRIATLLVAVGVSSAVLPSGLDAGWRDAVMAAGITVHSDEPLL